MKYLDPDGVVIMRRIDGKYFHVPSDLASDYKESFLASALTLGRVGDNTAFHFEWHTNPSFEQTKIQISGKDVGKPDEPDKPFAILGPPGIGSIPPIWAVE